MGKSLPLLFFLLFTFVSSHPVIIQINGTTYSLNGGLCEDWSCGQGETRGHCYNYIFSGRSAHYCKCNIPFTGSFCDYTLHLNTALPDSQYSECPFPLYCAAVYGNGECNQECNSAECLYDGYECQVQSVCPKEEYCSDRFSDGICDEECMLEECEFDGGDCFSSFDTLPSQLFVRLQITSEEFMRLSHLFLFQLSRFLRATVVLSQDAEGPLLWRWSEDKGRGARIHKGENSSMGIEVALSISLTRCSHDCLDSIDRIIGFIDKALASKSSPISSAVIQSVSSSSPLPSSFPIRSLLLCICGLLSISTVGYAVVQHRRVRKRVLEAAVWFPPEIGGVANAVQPLKNQRLSTPFTTSLHQLAQGKGPIYIMSGDDVNGRDDRGMTPLLVVIRSERLEEEAREGVKELLKGGADINAVDGDGWGSLHHAFHKLRSPTFNRWLISQGANPLQVDKKGRSLVHLSTEYNDLPNLHMILTTAAFKLIDSADDSNRIPLSIAVCDCTLSISRCLVDYGAYINSNGDMEFDSEVAHKYPLHYAVECNNKDHVMLLIDKGCRMEVRDNRLRTALHYAVLYADLHMCKIIVEGGTQVDATDDEDRTAEDIAANWEMIEIQQYLVSVRGRNEPYKKRRKPKRYSSDQGYGSEESQRQSEDDMSIIDHRSDTVSTPLPPLSSPQSFRIPKWGTMAQLPIFNPGPFNPLSWMSTPLPTSFPSVLTPSHKLLHGSSSSLAPPTLFSSPFHTPIKREDYH